MPKPTSTQLRAARLCIPAGALLVVAAISSDGVLYICWRPGRENDLLRRTITPEGVTTAVAQRPADWLAWTPTNLED